MGRKKAHGQPADQPVCLLLSQSGSVSWTALIFHSLCFCLVFANRAASSPSNMRQATVLPLHYGQFNHSILDRSTDSLRRNLLGEARMWLYGHILTRGYYYTNLWVGTPPQRFSLIVDTGSTVTYVPCSTCTECGVHQDSPFLPSASTSYHPIPCRSPSCPQQQCDAQQRCVYERHYAEQSSSRGVLASDVVGFGDASTMGAPRVVFGCETRETGDLYTQKADGIIGLGHGQLSIVDQLVSQGASADVFSLCYGGMERGGGAMVLGQVALPEGMVYTFLDPARLGVSAYYNLIIESLSVDGKKLDLPTYTFDQGYGTVLDSGTTFTYLPKIAFKAFVAGLEAGLKSGMHRVEGPDPKYEDVCFAGASNNADHLGNSFPQVAFTFGGGVVYHLSPENYLFKHHKVEGAYCLGFFQNSDAGTLLGGILVRNTLVTYDRAQSRVGFLKTRCEGLFDALPAENQTQPSATAMEEEEDAPYAAQASSPDQSPEPPEAPAGEASGDGTADAADAPCLGCAARVVVTMTLQSPDYDGFGHLIPEFVEDMARELSVEESQLEILGYDKGEPLGVRVRLSIGPRSPETFIPSAMAERIEAVLGGQELGLRDAFGGYSIQSVDVLPISPGRKGPSWWIWAILGLLGVLLLGSIAGGIAWWYRRKQQLLAYTTMGVSLDDDDDEEQMALGAGANANM